MVQPPGAVYQNGWFEIKARQLEEEAEKVRTGNAVLDSSGMHARLHDHSRSTLHSCDHERVEVRGQS